MQQTKEKIDRIIQKVRVIENLYQKTPGLILSESDLQCLIYNKLYNIFSEPEPTIDENIKAIALHAEISWYDAKGKLTIRPDITILDPNELSIRHGVSMRYKNDRILYGQLPSKGCEFKGEAIILEIKFIRRKNGISKKDISNLTRDIEKILKLYQRLSISPSNNKLYGIVIVFNKTNKGKQRFNKFKDKYKNKFNLKIIYGTGNVEL